MNNVKKNNVILALALISSLLFFLQGTLNMYSFAKEKDQEWNVKITSGTKDLTSKNTEEIYFEVQDNPNVAKGKLAPGGTAIATLNLQLNETTNPVDFKLDIEKNLTDNFELTIEVNGKNYKVGETITFNPKERAVNEIKLILEWKDTENTNNLDTIIASTNNRIIVPIKWEIKEHID